jgi:uncharacterized protein YneF (UPF0154 family)
MKPSLFIGLFMTAGLSLNAYAIHVDMKPGLWEHSFKLSEGSLGVLGGGQQEQMSKAMEEMKTQMANMPPEQRKMMEDMMAKQGIKVSDKGVDIAAQGVHISKDGTTVKTCLTQTEIDRGEMPQPDENCEQNITQVSATVLKVNYVCKGAHPSHGEGQIVFQSDKSYTGNMKLITEVNKKAETIESTQSGKWLSSDCGNIKPMAPKTK